jgi:predicted phage terminase large subunit-like protein
MNPPLSKNIAFSKLLGTAKILNPSFETEPNHIQIIADALEQVELGKIKRLMIFMPPRHGKLISHSTLVPTMLGWKTHGQLEIGDMVFTPNGRSTKVISTSEEDLATMEVELSNGDIIKTHPNHEWKVYSRPDKKWIVCETRYFLEGKRKEKKKIKLTSGVMGKRGSRYLFQVPNTRPLQYKTQKLLIDPYVLGAWLGDGSSYEPYICYAFKDKAVVDAIEKRGTLILKNHIHKTTGVIKARLDNAFNKAYKDLGVYDNKHIPDIYLRSSVKQRLQLLAGLIDTDGHVDTKCRVRIVTGCIRLANNIMHLVKELGMRPYLMQQQPCLSTSGIQGRKVIYTVGFQPTMDIPSALPRKQIFKLHKQKRIGIKDVRYTDNPEMGKCIQIESKDGIYLVGENLTPTHNSMLTSEMFPAWYLGRNPSHQIIFATYNQQFASDFGRKVRNHMDNEDYKIIFPTTVIADDSSAANRFHTTRGGVYYAVGAGSSITGRGAHVLLIDDLIKNQEEADSSLIRQKHKDWYSSTAYTRLEPNGAVVIIQTRWHNDDLSGWLLSLRKDDWHVISMPAISTVDGVEKALWPERYSLENLLDIKENVQSRDWLALYMQTPYDEMGGVFHREWIQYYTSKPSLSDMNVYVFVDPANSKDKYSDRTAILVIGANKDGNIYLLDAWVDRYNIKERTHVLFKLHEEYSPRLIYYEKYGLQVDIDYIKLEMENRNYRFGITEIGGPMGKVDRIKKLAPYFEDRKIFLPNMLKKTNYLGREVDLIQYFINEEYIPFPAGTHDDMIDAFSRIYGVNMMYPKKGKINYYNLYGDDKGNTRGV